jgi:hypothetical protein
MRTKRVYVFVAQHQYCKLLYSTSTSKGFEPSHTVVGDSAGIGLVNDTGQVGEEQ